MTFSEQFIEIFNFLAEQIGIVIDWTSENVIPYITDFCSRYINYEIATSIAWMVIMLVLLLITFITAKVATKAHNNCQYSDGILMFFSWLLFACISVATFIVIANQCFDIIKAVTIPEQVIMEKMIQIKNSLNY